MVPQRRPFTFEEREALGGKSISRFESLRLKANKALLVFFFSAVSASPGYQLGGYVTHSREGGIIIAMLTFIAVGTFLSLYLFSKPRETEFDRLKRQDLEEGQAVMYSYRANDAIQVEEFEDEGSQYFLRLEDGSVLFLSGQYLHPYEEQKTFPNSHFEIVIAPHSQVVLSVRCQGELLIPRRTLKAFQEDQFESGLVPENLQLLSISWDEIEPRFSSKMETAKGNKRRPS